MNKIQSPNFNERDPVISLAYIVLHYTGMKDAASAIARMCDPAAQVSAHYVIDEDGSVTQLVDENKRAWHAGKSFWRGITDINSASIGIELVNPGHEFGYRAFPAIQIAALKIAMHDIIERHNMNAATAPIAHSDIAPSRKQDPGELFPWQELAKEGLGIWPIPKDFTQATEAEIAGLLNTIGYDTTAPREALLAFQRRFHPENLTGNATPETVARLRGVLSPLP
ncbi:MAG: N-acetylmuramoyl-L-alanine amidase [Alphaproteobacteria bacterium]